MEPSQPTRTGADSDFKKYIEFLKEEQRRAKELPEKHKKRRPVKQLTGVT